LINLPYLQPILDQSEYQAQWIDFECRVNSYAYLGALFRRIISVKHGAFIVVFVTAMVREIISFPYAT